MFLGWCKTAHAFIQISHLIVFPFSSYAVRIWTPCLGSCFLQKLTCCQIMTRHCVDVKLDGFSTECTCSAFTVLAGGVKSDCMNLFENYSAMRHKKRPYRHYTYNIWSFDFAYTISQVLHGTTVLLYAVPRSFTPLFSWFSVTAQTVCCEHSHQEMDRILHFNAKTPILQQTQQIEYAYSNSTLRSPMVFVSGFWGQNLNT